MSLEPDLDKARQFLEANPPPGRVLVCAITGSHHYGFPSSDSDIDIKGIHLAPTRELLGLSAPRESFDRLEVFEDLECDLTTNEASQALTLLLRGNGNILERILSPYQLVESDELYTLRSLAHDSLSKNFYGHYSGYFRGMCREYEKSEHPTAKKMLYAYRVALTGTHLLRTRELNANVRELAPEYGLPEVLELADHKSSTREKQPLSAEEDEQHRANWPRLQNLIDEAFKESSLPERPSNQEECSEWLVKLRVREIG